HQLGAAVHLDELDEPRAVLVGHPVAGLDLAPGMEELEERVLRTVVDTRSRRLPIGRLPKSMSARREELTRTAARLFAERGYHGTSLADVAEAVGMQKASLYHHIQTKEDLLWDVASAGAEAFHAALEAVPE